jgi:hypothetical protein
MFKVCASVVIGLVPCFLFVSLHPYYHLLSTLSTGIRAPIQALRRFVQAWGAVQGGPV